MIRFSRCECIPAALLLMLVVASGAVAAADASVEQNGIQVDFSIEPVVSGQTQLTAGTAAAFRFTISNSNGAPMAGACPAAWMQRRADAQPTDADACRQMVQTFIGGSQFVQPSLNLNVYYVMVLNDDNTISVVDPSFGFGGSKLLTMIELSSRGYDWAYASQHQNLLVTLRETSKLALVDTVTFDVRKEIDLGATPDAVALQPDQQYAWVGYNDASSGGVIVVDVAGGEIIARIVTGRGEHRFAFSPDSRTAFVTNLSDNTVSLIDIHQLSMQNTIATGQQPVSIDYSSAANAVYVSHAGDGAIVGIDVSTLQVSSRTHLDPGLGQIRFAPGGRFAVVVNPVNDEIYVWDAVKNQVSKRGKVEAGPDQISFSDTLGYIRHRGNSTVYMLTMDDITSPDAPLQVVDFPAGQNAFGVADTPAPGIVQAPGANAVLVAHPSDREVYYYKEGMAAPMGRFSNYNRAARAVMALDRSLQEVAPGQYATTGRLAEPGAYDVAFFMDAPRVMHCFEVQVMPSLDNPVPAARTIVASLLTGQQFRAGQESRLQFQLRDSVSGDPVVGMWQLQVLAMLSPGTWQTRVVPEELGDGIYAFDWTPPQSGTYYVHFIAEWQAHNMDAPDALMFSVEP